MSIGILLRLSRNGPKLVLVMKRPSSFGWFFREFWVWKYRYLWKKCRYPADQKNTTLDVYHKHCLIACERPSTWMIMQPDEITGRADPKTAKSKLEEVQLPSGQNLIHAYTCPIYSYYIFMLILQLQLFEYQLTSSYFGIFTSWILLICCILAALNLWTCVVHFFYFDRTTRML